MNIFYLDHDPKLCAKWAVDRHCVKMILESAQLLSTAHRLLDGTMYTEDKVLSNGKTRKTKRWLLPDTRENVLYSATHINHPCAVWCRKTQGNYHWLVQLLEAYCHEYTHRYGKVHKVESGGMLYNLYIQPTNIILGGFTPPPCAMDDEYIISASEISNYRNYYKYGKAHLHSWKNRQPPEWLRE